MSCPWAPPLREIIFEHAGGMRGDKPFKACIPGGASTPVLTAEHLDVPMDFESVVEAGSMLGTGAIVVMEEGTDMVDVARRLMHFFVHESCGKCTPCRGGTRQLADTLDRIVAGQGQEGDIDLLQNICQQHDRQHVLPDGRSRRQPRALDAQALPRRVRLLYRAQALDHRSA